MSDLAKYRRVVDELLGEKRRVESAIIVESREAKGIERKIVDVQESQQIVQSIAQAIQNRVHRQVSSVVTSCLNAVFEEPYEFRIRFDMKRGKTDAQMVFERDGVVLEDPLNEVGGGVIDVASLALRVSNILLSRPTVRRLLVLDEPFRSIRGKGNRDRTRVMLQRLVDDLGMQVILNTDIEAFRLGKVVELPQ
jgi:hypothetical protein